MKTISQDGDALADYDARVSRYQRTGRVDGFENDATALMPSRVLNNALAPDEPVGAVGFFRSIWRAIGYCFVFVLYGFIFGFAAIAAESMSPHPAHLGPLFWMVAPVLFGLMGVGIHYRVNQRRRLNRQLR